MTSFSFLFQRKRVWFLQKFQTASLFCLFLEWTKFDFWNQVIWNGLIFIFSRFWNEPLWDIWNFKFLENISTHKPDWNWNLILEFQKNQKHVIHWSIPRCASRQKAFNFEWSPVIWLIIAIYETQLCKVGCVFPMLHSLCIFHTFS